MKKRRHFFIMVLGSLVWLLFSVYLSLAWIEELTKLFPKVLAIVVIGGIAYLPGFLAANLFITLLFVNPKPLTLPFSQPLTVLIPAHNEEKNLYFALEALSRQDYPGKLEIIVIDNASTDKTREIAEAAKKAFSLNFKILSEPRKGKHHALNTGLKEITTKYFVCVDADTVLHEQALSLISAKIAQEEKTGAVAGGIFVKNRNDNLLTRMQYYDYFLSINAIKHLQSHYGSTLVAQGAFSIYDTALVKELGGWDEADGEDIVLTWKILRSKRSVLFEPRAASFTVVPSTIKSFFRQRRRWAKGMIEGLRTVKPWEQRCFFAKYFTFIDLLIPLIDACYLIFFLPGIILSFFGFFYLFGPISLYVIPLFLFNYWLIYQITVRQVFKPLQIKCQLNFFAFLLFMAVYQILMAFSAFLGYLTALWPQKIPSKNR
ncbi:MAG TPA: glycosyltransferase [Bacilli bacterium]|nr:glycosyltransferase [Bacilli bacterium]HPK58494.1 glycosyltransferase [Bacilli bacterium]